MYSMFLNPEPEELCALLKQVKTIAVVGLSPQPVRPSYRVASKMQSLGVRIIPVRPLVDSVLGEKAYATLDEVPDRIDLVNVFRPSEQAAAVVIAAIEFGAPAIWLQQGIVSDEGRAAALAAGLEYVEDQCIAVIRSVFQVQPPHPQPVETASA